MFGQTVIELEEATRVGKVKTGSVMVKKREKIKQCTVTQNTVTLLM